MALISVSRYSVPSWPHFGIMTLSTAMASPFSAFGLTYAPGGAVNKLLASGGVTLRLVVTHDSLANHHHDQHHHQYCRLSSDSTKLKFNSKGAITSKIKHAIKHKTSPARLAQLLHNCIAALISISF